MILIVILIIIFFLVAYYLGNQTSNNNIAIQQYVRKVDPTLDSPFIICVLRYGLGNRMNCLASSIILSRYLKRPLYVVWTDIDMGSVQLSDIWAPPYPFTLLDQIPPGIGSRFLNHEHQDRFFDNNQIRQINDTSKPFFSKGIVDLKIYDNPIIVLGTYWNFKHPDQSLSDFYEARTKIFNEELVPVPEITERIQSYRALCDSNTFGVHIRLTDSCVIQWGSQEACESLVNKIHRCIQTLLNEDPERTVFLCTDDQRYIQDLIRQYGSRIIIPNYAVENSSLDRFSILGQQEAYAEIMALSYCSPLLLSLRSTFSSGVASLARTEKCTFYSPMGDYVCL
jgi:hypothetical protein